MIKENILFVIAYKYDLDILSKIFYSFDNILKSIYFKSPAYSYYIECVKHGQQCAYNNDYGSLPIFFNFCFRFMRHIKARAEFYRPLDGLKEEEECKCNSLWALKRYTYTLFSETLNLSMVFTTSLYTSNNTRIDVATFL